MTRYWGMIFIMFFSLFWIIVSVTTSIDLTLIGHLRGWKKLPYAKWLGGFIDKTRKGYKYLSDHTTHPQVVVMLLVCFGMLCLFVAMEVFIWFVANDIETFILWIIDAVLYIPTIVWLFFSKIEMNNEYKKYISNVFKEQIKKRISKYGATLVRFNYDYKYFGNVFVVICDSLNKIHEYSIDRGDICVGSICKVVHSDCCGTDPKEILLDCIEKDLKQ